MKDTIQKYGWIVITVLVIAIMIGLAFPAASFIKDKFAGTVGGMGDKLEDGMNYTPPYTVQLKTNIDGAGTVEFTGEYSGTKVDLREEKMLTFKAEANNGFRFLGWYIGETLISEDAECTAGYTVNKATAIIAKFEAYIAPGLYDANGNLVASWDNLVNTYGMDIEKDYTSSNYSSSKTSPYYVLTNNTELSTGVKLIMPDSVTTLDNFALSDCPLTSIVIGNGVTKIGQSSFESSLISITIKATTPPEISSQSSQLNASIYVPAESVEAYKTASGWSKYAAKIQAIPTTE